MSVNKGKTTLIEPKFFNREMSWLAFNERVLDQAFSDKYPLLERTRFLSFVSSNLDQFYDCLLYTSPSPRDGLLSRMPSSA